MRRALVAGTVYFGLIFGLGFVLGTIRTLLIEPRVGLDSATLLELPLMLIASWLACGWVLRRTQIPAELARRGMMGGTAFLLLMIGETLVSTQLMGRSLTEHLATYAEPARQWGLAAQVAFALFPLLRR